MKICLKCHRGLLDRDVLCDRCGCTDIIDKEKYLDLCRKFQNANKEEQQNLRQSSEYSVICKYKFKIDERNTSTMREDQSRKDKEKNKLKKEHLLEFNYSNITTDTQSSQPNIPKCPICGSTNLSKISAAKKVGKIALFGIFGAGDIGKTWKCNDCGSKF